MQQQIPDFARSALWSYDIDALDLRKHKKLIIKNILDHGSKKATDWLRGVYSADDLREVIRNMPKSAWEKVVELLVFNI